MTEHPQSITRRDCLTAFGIGLAGVALTLRGASAALPDSNARAQPSTLNVVMYADKIDVDLRLAPFRAGTKYTLSVHSECQVFQGFAIENSNGETVASLQNVPPKQTTTLDVTFPEAGDYAFVNKSLGGYYIVTPYTTKTTVKCEAATS
jgi:hypothetical protein